MARATLVAVEYASEPDAERALGIVRDLDDEDALAVHDAAIVVKHADGRVELRQSRELAAGEAAVGGGSIGILLGLAVAIPVAGALVGVAAGMGFAALDKGISNKEMRHVGGTLAPGEALLFALVGKVDWDLLASRLEPVGGKLVASEVSDEVLDRLGVAARSGRLARVGFGDGVVEADRAHDLGAGGDDARRADDRRDRDQRAENLVEVELAVLGRAEVQEPRDRRSVHRDQRGDLNELVGLLVETRRLAHAVVHVRQDPEPRQVASRDRPKTFRGFRLCGHGRPFPKRSEFASKD